MNNNEFLTVKDMSEIFGISVQAVYDWINDKRLKIYQVSSRKRIRPEDLLQYLKDRGNSDYSMKEFKHDIEFYLMEKAMEETKTPEEVMALQEKDPKMFGDVMMNSKSHLPGSIVGAKMSEEAAKQFAEIKKHEEERLLKLKTMKKED